MLYIQGTGMVVDGPFIYEADAGDVVIQYRHGATVQCLAMTSIVVRQLMDIKKGYAVRIEGILIEDEPGYPAIRLAGIRKIAKRNR